MAKTGIQQNLKCPDCGDLLVYRTKGKFGPYYSCVNWPKCSGAHSAYEDGTPMGVPANHETRQKRRAAHDSFDALRIELGWSRSKSYRWLAKKMNLSPNDCHIGRFNINQCEQVINICEKIRATTGGTW